MSLFPTVKAMACSAAVVLFALNRPAVAQPLTPTEAPALLQDPAPPVSAQPASGPFDSLKFGATLEGYYEYSWNRPPDHVLLLHAYDTRANVFSIQQAAVVIESPTDVDAGRRFGARIDFQFGQATETVQGNPANEPRPDIYRNLWQAYGSYVFPLGRGLRMDFGKFASMLGYETNYAKDNQAFSRAYLFNFLPFYHAGLRVTLPVSDRLTFLYMLTNGVQQTEDFNDFKSNHVAAVVKPMPSLTWTVNYYFGQEQPDGGLPGGPAGWFRVFDTYATYQATSALAFGLDVSHTTNEAGPSGGSMSLQGSGAYTRYQLVPAAAIGIRYEHLRDEGLLAGSQQTLQEATLTGEYKLAGGFLGRIEFRRDWSNRPFFPGPSGFSDQRRQQNTLLIGGVWWFGNKQGAW